MQDRNFRPVLSRLKKFQEDINEKSVPKETPGLSPTLTMEKGDVCNIF